MKHLSPSICLAGAAPDTGNHGVTALCHSTLFGLSERGVNQFTVFDHGTGVRTNKTHIGHTNIQLTHVGFKGGKRIHETDNMHNMRLRQIFGLSSPGLDAIKNADAMLDVSGGDSFTDLYGPKRFQQITLTKLMALKTGTPLILLPQTYGPFHTKKSHSIARHIVRNSAMAWARDAESYSRLQNLLGRSFDPKRHRLGVDLAFGLPANHTVDNADNLRVGINVSGLLWNDTEYAQKQFGLKTNYKAVIEKLCLWLLTTSTSDIVLVPHVTPKNPEESDAVAASILKASLPEEYQHRVFVHSDATDPSSLKETIAKMNWFVGARMHATIAALSSGSPVVNMAYSMKAKGVFACCGAENQVLDLRNLTTINMLAALKSAFLNRHKQEQVLIRQLPFAKRRWAYQMDALATTVKHLSSQQETAYA